MGTDTSQTGDYASINGLNLYYEIHGAGNGQPLMLLPIVTEFLDAPVPAEQ